MAAFGIVGDKAERPNLGRNADGASLMTVLACGSAVLSGQGCCPRTDVDYAELRRHADALAADVIALQEVESKVAAERVFDPARYDVVMSARPQSRRGGTCYGKPGQSIGHQAVGFAIRKGVSWTRNDDLSALALGSPTCAGMSM